MVTPDMITKKDNQQIIQNLQILNGCLAGLSKLTVVPAAITEYPRELLAEAIKRNINQHIK